MHTGSPIIANGGYLWIICKFIAIVVSLCTLIQNGGSKIEVGVCLEEFPRTNKAKDVNKRTCGHESVIMWQLPKPLTETEQEDGVCMT